MVAFLPLIGLGASLVGSWLGGRKNKRQKGAEGRLDKSAALMSSEGQRYGKEFDSLAKGFQGQSKTVRGQPGYAQPMNYWQALLGGDRSKMTEAVSPQRRMVTDTYRGNRAAIGKSRMRGAAKDAALAESGREETANLAGLTQGLQGQAAQQMSGLEGEIQRVMQAYSGLGLNAKTQGANVLSELLGRSAYIDEGIQHQEESNRQQRSQNWGRIAGAAGDIVGGWAGGKFGGGGSSPGSNNVMPAHMPGRDMYGNQSGWRLPQGTFAQPFNGPNGGRFLDYNTMMGNGGAYGTGQPYGIGF